MADTSDHRDHGPTDEALRELLRAEHHRAAVEDRRRRRELHRQVVESRSLLDVLSGITGTGTLVAVHTRRGLLPPSTVVEVGEDYVATRTSGPETRLVPRRAISSVRLLTPSPPTLVRVTRPSASVSLHERLTDLALRRPLTTVWIGGTPIEGRLTQVGLDLLAITGDDGSDHLVALDAIDELQV